MKNIIYLLSILFLTTSFKNPGSADAYLICKSASGRTTFTAEIQDIDGVLKKGKLVIDNSELNFSENDECFVIFDPKVGVYTLSIENSNNSAHKFLKLWAIPKSFQTVQETGVSSEYKFTAKLISTEPRKINKVHTPEIELNCELRYKI